MDDQDSPSSALMIGLIVGGGVVLLLVVLMVFGAGFFFMARHADVAVAPVAAPPMVAPPMVEEGPAPPAPPVVPAPAVKGRDRLIGTWETKTDAGHAIMQFLADGTLEFYNTRPDFTRPNKLGMFKTQQGRWDILEEADDKLKLRSTPADNTDSVQDIRFDGPDRFVIEGKGGGATYNRKAK